MHIKKEELDGKERPTLEDILAFINGGKYQRFFLKKPKVNPDGTRWALTETGSKLYAKLVSILYAADRCAVDGITVEDIVNILDDEVLGY